MSSLLCPSTPARQYAVYIMLVLCTLFWGSNFNLGKYVIDQGTDPLAAAGWRFVMAALLMVGVLLAQQRPDWQGLRRNSLALGSMGLIGVFGFTISFFYGMRNTSSINAALIMALNPALTMVMSAFITKEVPGRKQLLGLLLGLMGVSIVVTGGTLHALLQLKLSVGDLLIALGNLCWAAYGVIGKHAVKNMNPLQTTATTMVIGAVLIILLAVLIDGPVAFAIPAQGSFLALMTMALFGTVLGYLFWNQGISRLGIARTAVFFNLVPLFTMLIAMLGGHPVLGTQWLGAFFIIAGVLMSSSIQATGSVQREKASA